MRYAFLAVLLAGLFTTAGHAQTVRFRDGIFLHHSTGGCIWGPNGSSVSVPQQMDLYNQAHGFLGADQVTLDEQWFPGSTDNEWVTWHSIFEGDQPEAISGFYPSNRIIMIKSCFPSSDMSAVGGPSDTTSSWSKTIYNYKWHWRHIVARMRAQPDNFFVIWTNAPLERQSTNATSAHLSDQFCTWAKDTLAIGADPVFGPFPHNVYVFDFFHKLTDSSGFLMDQYRASPGDSHPNASATALVAPGLVQEIFDHSIAYESYYNGPANVPETTSVDPPALAASPNPFSREVTIHYAAGQGQAVEVRLYDPAGRLVRTLAREPMASNLLQVHWDGCDQQGRPVASGVYRCCMTAGQRRISLPIVLLR